VISFLCGRFCDRGVFQEFLRVYDGGGSYGEAPFTINVEFCFLIFFSLLDSAILARVGGFFFLEFESRLTVTNTVDLATYHNHNIPCDPTNAKGRVTW
jgi:hypothetical protein